MWGARKRLARIKRHHRRAGGAGFRVRKCRGRQLGRSSGHSLTRQDPGAGLEPQQAGQGAQLQGATELGQGVAEVRRLWGSRMNCLPGREEAAASGSLC